MSAINEITVRKALSTVLDPQTGMDIVALNRVSGFSFRDVTGGLHVTFALEVDPAQGAKLETMRQQAEQVVRQLAGVVQVSAVLTAQKKPAVKAPHGGGAKMAAIELPNVKHIIAIASGKGGVGKSTTAVNLALALVAQGLKVGLFDADIYGPSTPRMLGIKSKPILRHDKKLEPIMAYGLAVMSIGFLMAEEDSPLIWRGPMVQGALQQMLRDVAWGSLDIMVIDMPPGTGDAQLAITQMLPLAGAVIVSTPQDIALLDAKRGLHMFRRVEVPVLGFIENMSYFICPHCQGRSEIFSHGGAEIEAKKMDTPFLGAVPLELAIRQSMDEGKPIVVSNPDSQHARIYTKIAQDVWGTLCNVPRREQS
jgi:ATP-binding protein involved in chromosome partitioning